MGNKMHIHVQGMTCTGCETRIERAVRKLDGIEEVKAVYGDDKVHATYDPGRIGRRQIIEAIEKLGYSVSDESADDFKTDNGSKEDSTPADDNRNKLMQLAGIGVIILSAYLIIDKTIGFSFIPEADKSMGHGILFALGLLTSLHCIAMCGGINLSVCVQYKVRQGDGGKLDKLVPSALYNLGRVVSYTLIGGIAGALGRAVSFTGAAKGVVAVVSGLFMLIMGLNMLNIFPWLRKLNVRLPRFLGRKVYSGANKKGAFVVGLINGLMPCGPLQAVQLYALGTGSFLGGALSMLLFGLGTVPLMFGFGAVSSYLGSKLTRRMMKISAVLIMVLGVIMLNRGLHLSGLSLFPPKTLSSAGNVAKIEGGVQYVTTELEPGRYAPIIVQKGIPVKWTIKAEKGDLNGCNNPVVIPKYGMQSKLKAGNNIIEFTPEEEGDIVYTCWMGMISSIIRVVPDIGGVSSKEMEELVLSNTGLVNKPVWMPEDEVATGKLFGKSTLKFATDAPDIGFAFFRTAGEFFGHVEAVDDINGIDIEAIKEEIRNCLPSPGGAGVSCH